MQSDQRYLVNQFSEWLSEAETLLKQQMESALQLQQALVHLDIDHCAQHLESQQAFLIKAKNWHRLCLDYWVKLGYPYADNDSGLAAWLENQQMIWEQDADWKLLWQRWSEFRTALAQVQELNATSQVVVEQLSEDTRRKLHALLEYVRGGTPMYTPDGDHESADRALSSELIGSGRLLAKG